MLNVYGIFKAHNEWVITFNKRAALVLGKKIKGIVRVLRIERRSEAYTYDPHMFIGYANVIADFRLKNNPSRLKEGDWVKDAKREGIWNDMDSLNGHVKDMESDLATDLSTKYGREATYIPELKHDIQLVKIRIRQLKGR